MPLEVVGETGFDLIFDIAFADGRLYGITAFDDLVEIDLATGVGSLVGDTNIIGTPNALGPRDATSLIAATTSGDVYRVFVADATAIALGSFGAGQESSGDLARDLAGTVFGVDDVDIFGEPDMLINVHPDTGFASPIGSLGFQDVYGLAVDPITDVLYGAVDALDANKLVTIDKSTGLTTLVGAIPTTHPIGGLAAAPFSSIFADGFESGNLSAWN